MADDARKRLREGKPSIEIAPNASPAKAEKQEIGIGAGRCNRARRKLPRGGCARSSVKTKQLEKGESDQRREDCI